MLPTRLDLLLDTYVDRSLSIALNAPDTYSYPPPDFTGATAELMIRGTGLEASPLVTLSTTAGAAGQIRLGIVAPGTFAVTAADVPSLAATDTSGLASGTTAYVESGPVEQGDAWYAWAPGSGRSPDGVTVVAGQGGNWLLTGTIILTFTAAGLAALVGVPEAVYDLTVTASSGLVSRPLEGDVWVGQTVTHD